MRPDRGARRAAAGGGILALRARLLLLGLAIALRGAIVGSLPAPTPDALVSDARLYHDWAAAEARGEDFVGPRPYWLPPGYPLLLSLLYRVFGADPLVAVLFQSGLGVVTVGLVHALGRRLYGERIALLAGLLALFYAPFPYFEGKLLAASACVPLLLISLLSLLGAAPRAGRIATGGIAGGLASVLHPGSLLPCAALGASLLGGSGGLLARCGRAALYALALSLPILPVTARNLRASGQLVLLSANGGANLYLGLGPGAGATFRSPSPAWDSIFEQREAAIAEASALAGRPLDESETSRVLARAAADRVLARPAEAASLLAAKGAALLSTFEFDPVHLLAAERSFHPALRLPFLPFAALLPLAAMGALLARPPRPAGARAAAFLAGHAALGLLFFAYSRFRIAGVAALLPFAAAGISGVVGAARSRVPRRRALLAAAACAGLALASVVPLRAERSRALSRGYASLGFRAFLGGDLPAAERAFDLALRASESSVAARLGLAQAARARGRDREALDRIARPGPVGEAWAPLLLERGSLRAVSGDPEVRDLAAAESDFRRVLSADPASEAALFGMGAVASERAKGRGAADPLRRADLLESEGWFRRLVEAHPRSQPGWKGLAEALRALGRRAEAETAERRSRELEATDRG